MKSNLYFFYLAFDQDKNQKIFDLLFETFCEKKHEFLDTQKQIQSKYYSNLDEAPSFLFCVNNILKDDNFCDNQEISNWDNYPLREKQKNYAFKQVNLIFDLKTHLDSH